MSMRLPFFIPFSTYRFVGAARQAPPEQRTGAFVAQEAGGPGPSRPTSSASSRSFPSSSRLGSSLRREEGRGTRRTSHCTSRTRGVLSNPPTAGRVRTNRRLGSGRAGLACRPFGHPPLPGGHLGARHVSGVTIRGCERSLFVGVYLSLGQGAGLPSNHCFRLATIFLTPMVGRYRTISVPP